MKRNFFRCSGKNFPLISEMYTCTSINMIPREKDEMMCQLSDSDQLQYPNELKPTAGLMYRGTEVRIICRSSTLFTIQAIFLNPLRVLTEPD